jgi:hypothetical protein
MKIIPVEKKKKVLAFFRQTPVPSFVEIAKQTGVRGTSNNHIPSLIFLFLKVLLVELAPICGFWSAT